MHFLQRSNQVFLNKIHLLAIISGNYANGFGDEILLRTIDQNRPRLADSGPAPYPLMVTGCGTMLEQGAWV